VIYGIVVFGRQNTRESKAELRRQREAVVADPRTRALAQAVDAKIDVLETQALGNVAWCVVCPRAHTHTHTHTHTHSAGDGWCIAFRRGSSQGTFAKCRGVAW